MPQQKRAPTWLRIFPVNSPHPSRFPSKNRNDPKLNLSAALYSWYRGDKDIARVYFDAATKAGADVAAYLPSELSAPEPIPLPEPTPPPPSPGKEAAGAATTNVPGKFTMPPDDGMNKIGRASCRERV